MTDLAGRRERRKLRRLVKAGDRGDQIAIELVWQAWLRHPDEARWALLSSWRDQSDLSGAALAAAVDLGRSPGERSAIGQFCARHGLTPDDDIQQLLFYVLTAQSAQHRAVDARGRMLATAYQRADERTQAALRQMLASAGDADLISALAAACQRADATTMTEESKELMGLLAAMSEWDRLWRLIRELPLAGAVMAVRHFGLGCRPDVEGDRVLFKLLVRSNPVRLARARDALTVPAVTRVRFRVAPQVWGGAVSADGSLLALVRSGPDGGTISVHELPGGTVTDRVRRGSVRIDAAAIRSSPGKIVLAFAGDALIAARAGCRPASPDALLLLRQAGRRQDRLTGLRAALGGSTIRGLAPCFTPAGGFAVLCDDHVTFCDSGGVAADRIPLSPPPVPGATPTLLATEPGGRIAVASYRFGWNGGFAVYDAHTGHLAATGTINGKPTGICFHGPGRLIVTSTNWDTGKVQIWHLDSSRARSGASASIRGARDPVVIPGLGLVGVLGTRSTRVRMLDPVTLAKASAPEGFPCSAGRRLWNSADGRILGTGGTGFAAVFPGRHSVLGVADRPPAEWEPADLVTIDQSLGDPAIDAAARPLLELLRAGFRCRPSLSLAWP